MRSLLSSKSAISSHFPALSVLKILAKNFGGRSKSSVERATSEMAKPMIIMKNVVMTSMRRSILSFNVLPLLHTFEISGSLRDFIYLTKLSHLEINMATVTSPAEVVLNE